MRSGKFGWLGIVQSRPSRWVSPAAIAPWEFFPLWYVTRLMELAKDPFPVDRVCRWRRLTSFSLTRTKRELSSLSLPSAISLRTLPTFRFSSSLSSRSSLTSANFILRSYSWSLRRASITLVPELLQFTDTSAGWSFGSLHARITET